MKHHWDLNPQQARALQASLAAEVILEDRLPTVHHIAGVDVGFEDQGATTRAAVVVLRWPDLALMEERIARLETRFPYVPGLLSFRELPAVLKALERLQHRPDLVLCDGQGIAHPRRFGIACHLGVLTGLATIGVAKSRLTGQFTEPGLEAGDHSPLMHQGKQIGIVLRSRRNVRPLFVSPGHNISLQTACQWVSHCATGYRLPEPTRLADKLASRK